LPERVEKAAREHVAAGTYQTLVFGVVDGGSSEVVAFGAFDGGKAADGDTVYEIGSITKTFTAALLAEGMLSGRVTLETPVAQLLPDFKIPSRGGKEITLGWPPSTPACRGCPTICCRPTRPIPMRTTTRRS
jgi:CubicO group peptidase (beta-lactamase class C family)